MKVFGIAIVALIFYSCNILDAPEKTIGIKTEFILADTLGNPKSTFRVGENFFMKYTVINETGDTQNYTIFIPTIIVFEVWKDELMVSSSIDGLMWIPPMPWQTHLQNNDTISVNWLAPNSLARPNLITLTPGNYEARGRYPANFENFGSLPEKRLPFVIERLEY